MTSKFATSAVHAGSEPDPATGAVVPAIHTSTIYAFEPPAEPRAGFEYARHGTPTRTALERCLAVLENAPADCPALAFSSGMAAIDAAFRLLRPGDGLLLAREMYGGTFKLVESILAPAGIKARYVDATDPEAFRQALDGQVRLAWLESPSNPLMRVTDLSGCIEAAHAAGALVGIDSTFATPVFQTPLDLGADIVMHSTTKYLGGHSDVLGGALIVRDAALRRRLYDIQKITGAVASPFDCWLTLRGIRTLAIRMRAHEQNALAVAQFLEAHARVRKVYYPGLPSHPHHDLARRQMRGFGGMVAFEVEGDAGSARRILERARVFVLAASLGGVESIISYPALMSHVAVPREERLALGITDNLIRLSVGIEDPDDLIADLEQALAPKSSARP